MQESEDSSALFAGKLAQNYDQWYETPSGRYAAESEKKLFLKLVDSKEGQSLLDIGCGTGYFSFWFHSLGLKITGIDTSLEMLNVAKSKIKNENIKFIKADAYNLPFSDNSFDLVVFITTLEFLSQPERALCEAFRVSKDKIFLGVLSKWSILAFKRRLKGLFKESVYQKANFYSLRGLKRLIKNCTDINKNVKLQYGKTLKGAFIGLTISKQGIK
jgi:ubiquinone/menaquinone biosynthesis C-methylase UbiE